MVGHLAKADQTGSRSTDGAAHDELGITPAESRQLVAEQHHALAPPAEHTALVTAVDAESPARSLKLVRAVVLEVGDVDRALRVDRDS